MHNNYKVSKNNEKLIGKGTMLTHKLYVIPEDNELSDIYDRQYGAEIFKFLAAKASLYVIKSLGLSVHNELQ